jgi:hypothetical protein
MRCRFVSTEANSPARGIVAVSNGCLSHDDLASQCVVSLVALHVSGTVRIVGRLIMRRRDNVTASRDDAMMLLIWVLLL